MSNGCCTTLWESPRSFKLLLTFIAFTFIIPNVPVLVEQNRASHILLYPLCYTTTILFTRYAYWKWLRIDGSVDGLFSRIFFGALVPGVGLTLLLQFLFGCVSSKKRLAHPTRR